MKRVMVSVIAFILLLSGFTSTVQASSTGQLIIINKSTNQLAFFDNGKIVKTFKVATGRSMSYTPEGTFSIVNKIKNRPYYKKNIPGGSPNNPLGDRWLGLNARGTYGTTYAIHGNNNPSSIGKYVSSGCVRMYDNDVRWLFDRVKLHTKVVIGQFGSKKFEDIAKAKGYTTTPPPAPFVCKSVCHNNVTLSKGQIGYVEIYKPMPLLEKKDDKYTVVGTLPAGGTYKVYEVDRSVNVVSVGGRYIDYNLQRLHVSYLPTVKINELKKYYKY
ncbi:hypothetical protein JOC83_001589 [Bacillus iocasae]|uniref:L,D-TPase catalytic domain-containing protein n=1 Tax=Priestia iocasae TaxID=2291674 RepID=A0ABS2QTM9_9BACI|nr:hypothetical protein [Metabacillus iocasae]